jgi:dienelactone hydrolase
MKPFNFSSAAISLKTALIALSSVALFQAAPASAAIVTKTVEYQDAKGAALEGYVVYDDKITGPRPGVIVVHDWRGLTDYTKRRATMLAELGYIAFAADIYGKGVHLTTPAEWMKEIGIYKGDRPLFRQREHAAYDAFLQVPQLDTARVAAIGYCFGGTGVIEMAKDGLELKGVVSFHGGLDAKPIAPGKSIKTKVLALCGADDPYEPAADFAAFEDQLRTNKVDYQIVKYSHAVHAFTDPEVDALNQPGAKYNAAADVRSWQAMKDFFTEIFTH